MSERPCEKCAYRFNNSACSDCKWLSMNAYAAEPEKLRDNWFGAPHLDVRPKAQEG